MPQTFKSNHYVLPDDAIPHRHRLSRADAEFLARGGLLVGRYELIDGVIISKMGQRPPHSKSLTRLNRYLVASFGVDYVRIQSPVDVSEEDNERNEPEPDGAVTARPVDELPDDRNPGPADCVLLVEISDSTARFDLTRKAQLYARAGFAEYWVVDLNERRLFIHRGPNCDNSGGAGYSDIAAYDENETAAPQAAPTASVRVTDLLPPHIDTATTSA